MQSTRVYEAERKRFEQQNSIPNSSVKKRLIRTSMVISHRPNKLQKPNVFPNITAASRLTTPSMVPVINIDIEKDYTGIYESTRPVTEQIQPRNETANTLM